MSPLVDVTNSGAVNNQQSKKPASQKGCNRHQKRRLQLSDRLGQSTENTTEGSHGNLSSVSCDTNMCNTRLNNGMGKKSSQSEPHKKESAVDTMRVPPLPQASTDMLSQAVEALSLSSITVPSKPSARFNRQRKLHHKHIGKSSSGHPENTNKASAVRTPQQCGACGLEFTSLPVLTQHLAKHVYDGIYAAQWLTQAMALMTPRQSTDDSLVTLVHRVPSDSDCTGTLLQSTEQHTSSCSNL